MKKLLLALVLVAFLVQAVAIVITFTNPLLRRTPEPCRKSHVIYGAAGAGTNYQIRIKVHYGSGTDNGEDVYLNHNSRIDFGDVRFVDDDGTTELDYWRARKIGHLFSLIFSTTGFKRLWFSLIVSKHSLMIASYSSQISSNLVIIVHNQHPLATLT